VILMRSSSLPTGKMNVQSFYLISCSLENLSTLFNNDSKAYNISNMSGRSMNLSGECFQIHAEWSPESIGNSSHFKINSDTNAIIRWHKNDSHKVYKCNERKLEHSCLMK